MNRLDTCSKLLVDEKIKEGKLDYLALSGSITYGTNIETSDLDVRGILFPTRYDLLTMRDSDKVIDKNDSLDLVLKPFKLEFNSLMKCNPNVLELLSVKEEHILYMGEKGKLLRENVDLFLNAESVCKSYVGYSYGEVANWERALKNSDYTKAYKSLMNGLRILYEGRDIMLGKGVKPYREEREYLLKIRNKEVDSNVVLKEIEALRDEIYSLKETSPLPQKISPTVFDLAFKINDLEGYFL